jgi:transglutaminase-like putative cysteine protease
MRNLVREFKKNLVIRNLACQLVKNVAEKNWVEEARAIHEFVKKKIRYVKDINGVETLHTPLKLLDVRQGDCDDKATLAATLLESIGHPTRFVAVGFGGYGFSHVYLETKIGKNWLALETTEPWPIGRAVKNATRKIEIYN